VIGVTDTLPVQTAAPAGRRFDRGDLLIVVLLALVSAAGVLALDARRDPRFLKIPAGNDVWFEGDQPTVADSMVHRWSNQSRNARHPLFPLLGTIPVYAFTTLRAAEPVALRIVITAFSVLWSGTLYVLLRGVTTRRADALVFTLLGHATAAALFWVPVPETYALGSVSVMAVLALCAWDSAGRRHEGWYLATTAFSLAVTTTNWLTGLVGLVTRLPRRRALQIASNSLCVVVVLWAVQHTIFPTAHFFMATGIENRYVLPHGVTGIPGALRAVFFHAVVMPRITLVQEPKWGLVMSIQDSPLGSSGGSGIAATVLWGALALLGAWTLLARRHPMRAPLALALAGHVIVCLAYGDETFLYTLLFAPVLVAVAAVAASTTLRPAVLSLALVLTLLLAINNWQQLSFALRFFDAPH
jgi:hypothetical protein